MSNCPVHREARVGILFLLGLSLGATLAAADEAVFQGLHHSSLGTAQLTENADNTLTVSNIGSSGLDGVRIDLGLSDGWDGEWLPIDMSTVPVGASLTGRLHGRVDGFDDEPIVTIRTVKVSDVELDLLTDFSPLGTTRLTVEFYFAGDLQGTWQDLPWDEILRANGGTSITTDAHFTIHGAGEPCDDGPIFPCLFAGYTFSEATAVEGFVFSVDEIRVYPEDATVSSVEFAQHCDLLLADIGEITINDEALRKFSQPNRALGMAVMQAGYDHLTISNIGSSGEDGVAIDVGRAERARVEWLPLPPDVSVGAALEAEARGRYDGVDDHPLGRLRHTYTVGAFDIEADFSDVGSPTQLVQVFANGDLLAEYPGQSGVVAQGINWPVALSKLGNGFGQTTGYVGEYPSGTIFHVGGDFHVGDELRILAEGGELVEHLSELTFRAKDIELIDILAETAVQSDQSADVETEARGRQLAFRMSTAGPVPSYATVPLRFELPSEGHLQAVVYDAAGRKVWHLVDRSFDAGAQLLTWNGRTTGGGQAGRGVYFVRGVFEPSTGGSFARQQRVVLLR